jgi:hypothetical protein
MGGFKWAPGFASRAAFEGPYQNGTRDQMRKGLQAAMRNYQRAVDAKYPSGPTRRVFSEMLRIAGTQAVAFVDALIPLADMLETTGMSEADAWERTALYPKALFDAIKLVRVTTVKLKDQGGAMLWGSMQTTVLVEEYAINNFIDHPKIASMLALSSMQKEGAMIKKLETDFNRHSGLTAAMEKRLKVVEQRK